MGNILKNSNGQVLLSGNNAFEITASIDSNIQADNIKKDVTILGVTGTYEGSNSGGSSLTFYNLTVDIIQGGSGGSSGGNSQ